jgi:lipopolysaccharide transport system ATP-binding protein
MAAVQSLCTRCLIIQNGEIAFNGEVSKSIQMYIEGNLPAGKNFYELKDIIRAKNLGLQIKFSRCAVLDSQNEPTTTIRFGESFSILLESIADSPQRGLNMVIGIDTIQQIRITTVRSEDLGILFNVSDLSPTRIIARFNEIVLYPGKYLITLAIRKGKIDLDVLWHIASFEVTELHFDGMSPYKGEWGLVKTNVNWSANEKD